VGPDLGDLWNRTRGFAAACPTIACRPLFWQREGDCEYLGVEYFEGTSLESLVQVGRMAPDAALRAAGEVVAALEATFEPSNPTDLARELDQLLATVEATPVCCDLNHRFLQRVVFPFVREGGTQVVSLRTRWSNGDLIPRNVLVNAHGEVRLVDYELASRTHFHGTDYWRWRTYSRLPPEARALRGSPDDSIAGTWWDVLAILQQLVIVRKLNDAVTARREAGAKFRQMVDIIVRRPANGTGQILPMLCRPADLLSGDLLRCHAQLLWKVVSRKFSMMTEHGRWFGERSKTADPRKYQVLRPARS
jgi:hypothetical protein